MRDKVTERADLARLLASRLAVGALFFLFALLVVMVAVPGFPP
jgi:hypothetical protein